MINSLQDRVTLNNGIKMPGFGFGVFQVEDDAVVEPVKNAILSGYRNIDTATIYGNEIGVGKGIQAGLAAAQLKREDLFVTSKVWNDDLDFDGTIQAFNSALEKLQLDYLDLYLIHWPGDHQYKEAWLALEQLYKDGKIKAIGVSNFTKAHLEDLASFATVTPVVNQIELHPMLQQNELHAYHDAHDIKTEAWSPLMQGQLLKNDTILKLADKHQKSAAQIILRWDVQHNIITIPKSVHLDRMQANADVFDFNLSDDDMLLIDNLNQDKRVGPDPATFNFK